MASIGSAAAAAAAVPVAVLGAFLVINLYLRSSLFSGGTNRLACLGAQEDRLVPPEARAGALQNNHDHTYQGSACPARLAAACPREPFDTFKPGALTACQGALADCPNLRWSGRFGGSKTIVPAPAPNGPLSFFYGLPKK